MNINPSYRYTKDHEWAKEEGGIITIGISDYAQTELGDVVFVELPQVGAALLKGDSCSNVESVKAVSDVYSPVDGEVTETNSQLEDSPESVNNSPYEDGWMVKIKANDLSQLESLMDSSAYEAYLAEVSE